jgi:hypothetical protein
MSIPGQPRKPVPTMREVQSQDWAAFFERVNRNEHGGVVSAHKVQPDGAKVELARNAAFEEIDFGQRDDCNDGISIQMSGGTDRRHEIVEPIRIKLMESENGATYQSVIIEAEDGATVLTFHPTIQAAWLSDLNLE